MGRVCVAVCLTVALTGCPTPVNPGDAGGFAPDASPAAGPDATSADAASLDATLPDAAASVDASKPDAGAPHCPVCPAGYLCTEEGTCIDRLCDANGWCWENPLPLGVAGCRPAVLATEPDYLWLACADHLLFFDGVNWNVSNPGVGMVRAILVFSQDDIWLGLMDGLAHWDGHTWRREPGFSSSVDGLWGVASDDLWAAGKGLHHLSGGTWTEQTPAELPHPPWKVWGTGGDNLWAWASPELFRWTGSTWVDQAPPGVDLKNLGSPLYETGPLFGTGPSDVWLFVQKLSGSLYDGFAVQHWNGTAWTEVLTQDAPNTYVEDVLLVSRDELWIIWNKTQFEKHVIGWDGAAWFELPALPSLANGHSAALSVQEGSLRYTTWEGRQYSFEQAKGAWIEVVSAGGISSVLPRVEPRWGMSEEGVYRFDRGTWSRALPRVTLGASRGWPSVWGSSDSDIWSVDSVLRHWDGTTWTASPLPSGFGTAREISGSGPTDVWVRANQSSRLLHFDGQAWSPAGVPPLDADNFFLWAALVSAAPGEIWVAGNDPVSHGGLLVRGDGTSWTSLAAPEAGALWGTSPTDVWLGGWGGTHHWDGTAWTSFPLAGVWQLKGTRSNDVMMLQGRATLRHWNGSAWTPQLEDVHAFCGSSQTWWAIARSSNSDIPHQRRGGVWSEVPLEVAWGGTSACYASEDGTIRLFAGPGYNLRRAPMP